MNQLTINQSITYINNEEVQPAPVVGEIFFEAIGKPLEHHLQDEDVGEDLVCVLQYHLDDLPLLNVDVLKGLRRTQRRSLKSCQSAVSAYLRSFALE